MRKRRIIADNLKIIVITCIVSTICSLSLGYATDILFAGNEVSYDNSTSGLTSTTVQGALDEMCTVADFSDRVSTLESHFLNNTTIKFNANMISVTNASSSTNRGLEIRDSNNKERTYLYYSPSDDITYLTANNSSGSSGQGVLNIKGNPVRINGKDLNILTGSWTPSIPRANITSSSGSYYVIGKIMFLYATVTFSSTQTNQGNLYINGGGSYVPYATATVFGISTSSSNDMALNLANSDNTSIWYTYNGEKVNATHTLIKGSTHYIKIIALLN